MRIVLKNCKHVFLPFKDWSLTLPHSTCSVVVRYKVYIYKQIISVYSKSISIFIIQSSSDSTTKIMFFFWNIKLTNMLYNFIFNDLFKKKNFLFFCSLMDIYIKTFSCKICYRFITTAFILLFLESFNRCFKIL